MDPLFQHCLELARLGGTKVGINPQVGAVIVHEGVIIGEGYHEFFGGPHAEVNAVASVQEKNLLPNSEMYVSLEPCCHFGKTPPCTNLILECGIKKVHVGMKDPNPVVAGKGIQMLKDHGVEVTLSDTPEIFSEFYRRFLVNQTQHRAWIVLKWAETADGFIAGTDASGKSERIKITSEAQDTEVHKLRAECQGILVGKRTALIDNPHLTLRHAEGQDPVRILIDRNLDVPRHYHIFSGRGSVIVLNESKSHRRGNTTWAIPPAWDPKTIAEFLYQECKISSVLVEGGKYTLKQFIDAGIFDEVAVFRGINTAGAGLEAPQIPGVKKEFNESGIFRRISNSSGNN